MKILDCTLRDGGYINNWSFSGASGSNIVLGLVKAGVDIIELGYLSYSKTFGTVYGDISNFLNEMESEYTGSKFVAMINYGEVDPATLIKQSETPLIWGIRLAFHQKDWCAAIEQAAQLQSFGYAVFIQPMLTQKYSDLELLKLVIAVNEINPYAFYIVDSFGSMDSDSLNRLALLIHNNLSPSVALGFHSHNNMQLSLANAKDILKKGLHRELIVDSTLMGIGRGAGNLPTELIAQYANSIRDKYDLSEILETIDTYIEPIVKESGWGPHLAHFLSAAINCHPNYASYLLEQKTLPVSAIQKLLLNLPMENRHTYNADLMEQLYDTHMMEQTTNGKEFLEQIPNNVLLIAPGRSVLEYEQDIKKLIEKSQLFVIAVNHVPTNIAVDMCFFSNQKRYNQFQSQIKECLKLVITSNIHLLSRHQNAVVMDYESLYRANLVESGNVSLLLINALIKSQCKKVWIAGLDGYKSGASNELVHGSHFGRLDDSQIVSKNNEVLSGLLKQVSKIEVSFVTPSIYKTELPLKIAIVIPARYKSSRFPGKPLAKIAGIPMIKRTYLQVRQVADVDVFVATDDKKIMDYCNAEKIPVIMTSGSCQTGTDRLVEFAEKLDYDFYINVQGDEPVISPAAVEKLIGTYLEYGETYSVYNCFKPVSADEARSPHTIKVVCNELNELMYMSRHPVPFHQPDKKEVNYKRQVCVYGFTADALSKYSSPIKSSNEACEDIEIIRFLDNGIKVKMCEAPYDSIAVDVPEDVIKVEQFLMEQSGEK